MFGKTKKHALARPVRKPLAPKAAALLREIWWLAAVALALYLGMILVTYTPLDPGWSKAAETDAIRNAGGRFGAWLADLLLYLFGLSAYAFIGLALFLVWWGYRRIGSPELGPQHGPILTFVGFLLFIVSSSALEALRFYDHAIALPLTAGGVLGDTVARVLQQGLGFDGSTVLLLLTWGVGLSLFTGLSWLAVSERIGWAVERLFSRVMAAWQDFRDRRAGQKAQQSREEVVQKEQARWKQSAPLRIETTAATIARSDRIEQEKQPFLFTELPGAQIPPLRLLDAPVATTAIVDHASLEATSRMIERKLAEFGVEVNVLAAYPGPVITRFEVQPASGVKGSQIVNLAKDLARSLSVVSIRVVETIPGKSCMGLEIPNSQRQTVRLAEILSSKVYNEMHSPLTLALGKDIGGNPVVADLAKMPHLLVAGATGSGKSVAINAMILSLIYKSTPAQVRLIMVDPKMLELSAYEGIPHLLAPVVTDMKLAASALNWCVAEMERRYKLMSALGVRNIASLNQKIHDARKAGEPLTHPFGLNPDQAEQLEPLPYIVVLIDELADLMMVAGKKVEELIARLAQKARAAGIHLVLATQRPSVDVITGLIKANIPTRIAFQVASRIDSRTILDQQGAEALLGQGDMLFLPPGQGYPQRVHGAFVSDDEVQRVTAWLKELGPPAYDANVLAAESDEEEEGTSTDDAESDPLYDEAVALVTRTRKASISAVQRHLRIGYNRAARLIEAMERAGLVSPMQSNGNREVLVPRRD